MLAVPRTFSVIGSEPAASTAAPVPSAVRTAAMARSLFMAVSFASRGFSSVAVVGSAAVCRQIADKYERDRRDVWLHSDSSLAPPIGGPIPPAGLGPPRQGRETPR